QDLGVTAIPVTHTQARALAMAARVAAFSEGALKQLPPPDDLYLRPVNTFVAGFVGHPPMNLIPGTFQDGEFSARGVRVALPMPVLPGSGSIGLRPEDLVLGGAIRGRGPVVAPLGRQAVVRLD